MLSRATITNNKRYFVGQIVGKKERMTGETGLTGDISLRFCLIGKQFSSQKDEFKRYSGNLLSKASKQLK